MTVFDFQFDFQFFIAYTLGGLTFLPACILVALAHAYISFPIRDGSISPSAPGDDGLHRDGDDEHSLLSDKNAENLLDKFKGGHEHDVTAGYFAVCREYVPGGVNGKPPERVTPMGTVSTPESPSVYQSMYRSIFDRRQTPTMDTSKLEGRTAKRGNNVFFIVLRHGHLMLYENSEQLEVKHVISLEHHHLSIYAGGDNLEEGELWIKRNALRLERKPRVGEDLTKPFFLFSENCSDKEDFYFALLEKQSQDRDSPNSPPQPLEYDSQHMIGLVQRLHSSEEQLQTRWINGLLGRLFLALYKTHEVEDFIRQKITKKISRVQKPAFLSGIILRKIDVGNGAPQFTNPKLRELTIHGDCCAEAHVQYDGNFKIEVAATARLDLGARFRAREVDLVLAVVVKKLTGMLLVKFKPPPSNRIWVSFERMPEMELSVEPIVSSRQITYGIILRAIQSRIKEVIAETIVLPNWDDIPFADTSGQRYRGGIWSDQQSDVSVSANEVKIPDDTDGGIVGLEIGPENDNMDQAVKDPPVVGESPIAIHEESSTTANAVPSTIPHGHDHPQGGNQRPERPPRVIRSTSFASAANPLLSNDTAESVQQENSSNVKGLKNATSSMIAMSHRSKADTNIEQAGPASKELSDSAAKAKIKSNSFDLRSNAAKVGTVLAELSHNGARSVESSSSPAAQLSEDSSASNRDERDKDDAMKRRQAAARANRKSMASIGAASAAAKKWGWGVLSRTSDQNVAAGAGTPSNPIGRGQPIPPSAPTLPSANGHRVSSMPLQTTQKKPLLSPAQPRRKEQGNGTRRRKSSQGTILDDEANQEGLLVVEAPADDQMKFATGEDAKEEAETQANLEAIVDRDDSSTSQMLPSPARTVSERKADPPGDEDDPP